MFSPFFVCFFMIFGLWGCQQSSEADAGLAIRLGQVVQDLKEDGGYYVGFCHEKFHCGGTLLSDRIIITAKHCIDNVWRVNLCVGHLSAQKASQKRLSARVKVSAREGVDLLILVLKKGDLKFNDQIYPAHLPTEKDCQFGTQVQVVGRGLQLSGQMSDELMVAYGKITNCDGQARRRHVICTGPLTCKGDSGGPLVVGRGSKAISVGTVGYGDGDCLEKTLTGHISTCANLEFIKKNLVGTLPITTTTTTTSTTTSTPKTTSLPDSFPVTHVSSLPAGRQDSSNEESQSTPSSEDQSAHNNSEAKPESHKLTWRDYAIIGISLALLFGLSQLGCCLAYLCTFCKSKHKKNTKAKLKPPKVPPPKKTKGSPPKKT